MKPYFLLLQTLLTVNLCHASLLGQTGGQQFEALYLEPQFGSWNAGWSVSAAEDVNQDGYADFLVGAPSSSTVDVISGKDGYIIFRLDAPTNSIAFGRSVDVIGDINHDGYPDFIVGDEWGSEIYRGYEGAAAIFSGKTGGRLRYFTGRVSGDYFGWAVSGTGDVNGDGVNDYMVGAPHEETARGDFAGVVRVYSGLSAQRLFRVSGEHGDDRFGQALDAAGDVNNDGFADIIIGAPYETGSQYGHTGAAYVISGFDHSPIYKFIGGRGEGFAKSVAGVGDVNGDGFDDIAVGAPSASVGPSWAQGKVLIYSGANGEILHKITGKAGDFLGWSVSGAGDVDGDGVPDIVIGGTTYVYDVDQPDGNAWIYSGATGNLLASMEGAEAQSLGYSVAGVGDVNNDGLSDVVLGAPNAFHSSFYTSGSTYVISFRPYLNSSDYTLSATTGGAVSLELDFPHSEENAPYQVLISGKGMTTSFWRGQDIPLIQDRLFDWTSHGHPLPMLQNGQGLLDSAGNATATFTVPAFAPISLIGTTRWFAAVSFDPVSLQVEKVSVALPLTIAP